MAAVYPMVIVLVIAIAVMSIGMILLILGLVLKKPSQWIPGAALTLIALIAGIIGFFFIMTGFFELSKSSRHNFNYEYRYEPYNHDNSQEPVPQEQAEIASPEISGFIRDIDNSLINITLIPDGSLKDYGINVLKIEYDASDRNKKVIPVKMEFSKTFDGQLNLTLSDQDNLALGNSSVRIRQNTGEEMVIRFYFEKDVDFLKARFARIKTSD